MWNHAFSPQLFKLTRCHWCDRLLISQVIYISALTQCKEYILIIDTGTSFNMASLKEATKMIAKSSWWTKMLRIFSPVRQKLHQMDGKNFQGSCFELQNAFCSCPAYYFHRITSCLHSCPFLPFSYSALLYSLIMCALANK